MLAYKLVSESRKDDAGVPLKIKLGRYVSGLPEGAGFTPCMAADYLGCGRGLVERTLSGSDIRKQLGIIPASQFARLEYGEFYNRPTLYVKDGKRD